MKTLRELNEGLSDIVKDKDIISYMDTSLSDDVTIKIDDKIYKNSLLEVEVTIKAPEGKFFQDVSKVSLDNWLCDLNISGGKALVASQNADLTELTLTIQTVKAV